jgi:hypothetical protein
LILPTAAAPIGPLDSPPPENAMKKLITVLAFAFSALPALAADTACEAQALDKKLAGAAKASFLKKCEADAMGQAAAPAAGTCEAKATEKKLAGAAKNSFLKKCSTDAKAEAAQSSCEAKAAEKKLAGAAKNSFTKKCVADSGA